MKGSGSIGMLAIAGSSDEEVTNARTGDEHRTGELVKTGTEEGAELVSGVECEEAGVGLGWKFGNRSLISSGKEVACVICGAGPA